MTTFTWTAGSGDWTTASDWNPNGVPNTDTAGAVIPDGSSGYAVTIGVGETEVVNSLSIGDFSGTPPTLEIAGTLQFAGSGANITFEDGTILVDGSGLVDGAANAVFFGSPAVVDFINNGTVAADAGTGADLQILTSLTNNGTLLADNGILSIGGIGLNNLSGTTLTGGTWIAQGPSVGTFNQIEIGNTFDAVIAVDAANIVLDGGATDIEGSVGGTFQPIEQQLQTIAASGTLQLLNSRGFTTTNTLTDAGFLKLQGGTLSTAGLTIAPGGTLKGFGVVPGNVSNSGSVVSSAGVLDVAGSVSAGGSLIVKPGSALVIDGAGTSTVVDDGTLYDASGLLSVASLTGAGTLVVQNGATIELAGTANQSIAFSGSNATLKLDNFSGYTGTLTGFAQGDTLELVGATATKAVVSGGSLVVMNGGSTIDTIGLAGSYAAGAGFSVSNSGGNAFIVNNSGAPLRQDFAFAISVNNTTTISGAQETAIVNDLSAAAQDWAQYLTGHTTLRIQLNIESGSSGSELANAGPTTNISNGTTLNGRLLDTPSSLIALNTGNYVPGITSDITVNFLAGNLGSIYVNPSPTPTPSGIVPDGSYDLVTVFRHELGHGFGFGGLTTDTGSLDGQETLFDHYIGTVNGTVAFTGSHAETEYGILLGTDTATPVPLTTLNNGEGYAHFANSTLDVNANDLMSGLGLPPATQRDISAMDLAVLQDIGAPVTAVVCFARGTRIAIGPGREVPIERLNVGDEVLALSGRQRIVWIGRRRIDCRRHPDPRKVWPVRIRAHAFGEGLPRRDLSVSPQHALFLDGVLIPAHCLIDDDWVTQLPVESVEYFHIELPRHDVVLAEGLPAESYLDCGDRMFFGDGGVIALHPDLADRIWESDACAPLKVAGPEVEAVRQRLAITACSPSCKRIAGATP